MGHGILLSGGAEVDFNIHGVFQYSFFGHPVWITTSHICILIVMLLLVAFAIAANRCMAKASQVPGSFQNVVEMIVEMLDGMVSGDHGTGGAEVLQLYRHHLYLHPGQQHIRPAGPAAAYSRLRCDAAAGDSDVFIDSHQ